MADVFMGTTQDWDFWERALDDLDRDEKQIEDEVRRIIGGRGGLNSRHRQNLHFSLQTYYLLKFLRLSLDFINFNLSFLCSFSANKQILLILPCYYVCKVNKDNKRYRLSLFSLCPYSLLNAINQIETVALRLFRLD